jgi:5-methylcytosine-specific restriction endonuclease McrA
VAWNAQQRLVRIKRIKRRDGNHCWLCGAKFNWHGEITIDHAIPKSRGGTNHLHNLRLAHAKCNHRRADIAQTPPKAAQLRLATIRFPLPVLELTADMRVRSAELEAAA